MNTHRLVAIVRAVTATATFVVSWLKSTSVALAASPLARPVQVDPRGGAEPPGFAGGPLKVLLLVVLLGVVGSVMTVVVVRLTRRQGLIGPSPGSTCSR